MADSDDEYDRKRRDKFQGERSESYRTSDRRKEDDSWSSRQRMRPEYRDRYSGGGYQSDMPPAKRMRYEMDDRRMRYVDQPYGGGYGGSWGGGPDNSSNYSSNNARSSDMETQPPIMTFKAFLQTQDDNITDEEAIAKYAEYKLEFRRQQLNEFFVAHKEEEWFKLKYHPEESQRKKDEHLNSLKRRAEVFVEMLDIGRLDGVKVEADGGDAVVKLLDSVVIRLEGGTDLDLTILDQPTVVEGPSGAGSADPPKESEKKKSSEESASAEKEKGGSSPKEATDKKKKKEEGGDGEEKEGKEAEGEEPSKPKKPEDGDGEGRKGREEDEEDRRSVSMEVDEDDEEEREKGSEEEDEREEMDKSLDDGPPGVDPESESEKEEEKGRRQKSPSSPEPKDEAKEEKEAVTDNGKEEEADSKTEGGGEEKEEEKKEKEVKGEEEKKNSNEDNDDASETDDVVPLTPRPLHRTSSIFLRTISPRITKTEIETICKRYPGFLRVSLADPQPEQHWFRRGWVTFRRDVNVKEICWNLNNIRVRDCELGAIVNRDLSRRVRTVSGLSAVKQVVLHDIKLCVKLIQDLDSRAGLWADARRKAEEEEEARHEECFGLVSGNPILKGITDFLVDEASAEEEELLGREAVTEDSKERINQAMKVLDKLLLYLRIVHSVDFYNQSHYPNEDEMPNRCGIMHLRGTPSSTEVSPQEITEYTDGFRTKLTALLAAPTQVEDSEMASLGAKSQESEVEKFILANTQELAKDKWLCPLSGKKFKGPEFVRKHIFNKFSNELEEVKKEVDYFNNYLRDPKRPQLAEHPGNRSGKKDPFGDGGGGGGGGFGYGGGGYRSRGSFGHFGPGFGRGRGFPRGRPMDYRPVITYRDLDAPCEPEEII